MAGDPRSDHRPRVVVLGGGFAGLYTARALAGAPIALTVVDRRNHHLFQPLLYQVATAALNPADIAYPIRSVLRRQSNAEVLLGEVTGVDVARRLVLLADGELAYDYLVVATGATHSYFGHPEWAERAPGLKTIEDALAIRKKILVAFEAAERERDPERRAAWLTFVVVGGGPTGVELAGAIAEIARQTMSRDFRHIDPRQARVLLVEGEARLLPPYPPALSESARLQLEDLGATVVTGARVTAIDDEGVAIQRAGEASPERLPARTVLWAAGVAASPIGRSLGAPTDRAGRVKVTGDLTIPGHPEVFVIGDLAAVEMKDGRPVPGVAPAAIQEGQYVGGVILRALRGEPHEPFEYWDKGSLATIGRAAAVADFGRFTLTGYLAWLAWLFIHVLFLIGFRSRLLVLIEWAWQYLTFQRGARLITNYEHPRLGPPE